MRDALIILLLLAVITLGYFGTAQQRQIKALEARAKTNSLELQDKCAKQAAVAFKNSGFANVEKSAYENHYNERLNKCLILIKTSELKNDQIFSTRILTDAFEGKDIGDFMATTAWKTPYSCTATLPSGEEKKCHSIDEFEGLIKVYMQ